MADRLACGWARRAGEKHSRAQHFFLAGVSVCPRAWPQGDEVLARHPKGMVCPDCVRVVNGKPPRPKGALRWRNAGMLCVLVFAGLFGVAGHAQTMLTPSWIMILMPVCCGSGHSAGPMRMITPSDPTCALDTNSVVGLPDNTYFLFWDDPVHAAQFCRLEITRDVAQVPAGRWYVAMTLVEPPGKYGPDGRLQQLDGTPYPTWRWSAHLSPVFTVGLQLPRIVTGLTILRAE